MDLSFVDSLLQQLQKNLGDTLTSVGVEHVDWQALLTHLLSQLIISTLYVLLFAGLYLLVMLVTRAALGAGRTALPWFRHVHTAVRYLMTLGATLAVFAQFGTSADMLAGLARAGLMALGFYIGWLALGRVIDEVLTRYRIDRSIRQLVENLFSVLVVVFGAVTVLAQFGFDVVSIVAGLGIAGIAVGFAAQSTLSNFIAGITLLIERPFHIGDWVVINGQEGKVVKIALRTTWLRTRDNIFAMIPNDSVASSDIVNYSAEGPTRINVSLGIAYKETAQAAREVILPVLKAHPEVIQRSDMAPRVILKALGNSSLDLVAQAWIESDDLDDQPKIMAELLERIKTVLDEAGIEIPFPHMQLFIDGAEGLKPVIAPLYPGLQGSEEGRA